jgi:hypothetical protein
VTGGPLVDAIRARSLLGLAALEAQVLAMKQAHTGRLKPAGRRYVRRVIDGLSRRIVAWQELADPEFRTQLEAIAEQVRVLQVHRRRCSRGRRSFVTFRGDRTEER